jgi:hypothetical protein
VEHTPRQSATKMSLFVVYVVQAIIVQFLKVVTYLKNLFVRRDITVRLVSLHPHFFVLVAIIAQKECLNQQHVLQANFSHMLE